MAVYDERPGAAGIGEALADGAVALVIAAIVPVSAADHRRAVLAADLQGADGP